MKLLKRKTAYIIYSTLALSLLFIQSILWLINKTDAPIETEVQTCNDVNFQKKYKGIVVRNFFDKNNHNRETVELVLSHGRSLFIKPHPMDNSGFYNFIETNDSIIKEDWGYKFRLKRPTVNRTFIIHPDYIDKE